MRGGRALVAVLLAVVLGAGAVFLTAREAVSQAGPCLAIAHLGRICHDGTNVFFDVDRAAADGSEAVLEPDGDFGFLGKLRIGSPGAISACLSRETLPGDDEVFFDNDCSGTREGLDCSILDVDASGGQCGGGSAGAPVSAEYLVGEAHAGLTAEVAPSAGGQVPVSSSSTQAAWGQAPTSAIADGAITEPKINFNNAPIDGGLATFQQSSGKLLWRTLESFGIGPQLGPCGSNPRCIELDDTDGDGDWADDLQKSINDLAYSNYSTVVVTGEVVATNSEGFFGINYDASTATVDGYDRLNNGPIAILAGGSCVNGAQSATINANGTITGNVSASGISVSNQNMECDDDGSDATCFSSASGDDFLNGPVDVGTVVCSRSGATNATCTSDSVAGVSDAQTGTCTSASLTLPGTVHRNGTLSLAWSAGTGATTCSYTRKADNAVPFRTNDATANTRLIGRWASTPAGTTTCNYTYVTSANGGISAQPVRIEAPEGLAKTDFKSRVSYCRNWNSETPTGYTMPACTSPGERSLIPELVFGRSWDGVEIACDPTLLGGGNVTHCFRMGSESTHGVQKGDRPGVRFDGAPVVSMSKASVTAGTDFHYGFFFDGIDDSLVAIRPKNTGDSDNLPIVFVADVSTLKLLSWAEGASTSFGDVYLDGDSDKVTVIGEPQGVSAPHFEDLYLGWDRAGYKDPETGHTTVTNNGCNYKGNAAWGTCQSVTLVGISGFAIHSGGFPRDFIADRLVVTGDTEFFVGPDISLAGPARIHCSHCERVRLHADASISGDIVFESDGLLLQGVINTIANDAIAPDSFQYKNVVMMLADGVLSTGLSPISTEPINSAFQGPGLIDFVGSREYVWTVDGQGSVSANSYMKRGDGFATLAASASYDTVWENRAEDSFLGAVYLELLEDVPSTATECEIQVEIAGGCTACSTFAGEPAGGKVFRYGGTDIWGDPLRDAGDWTLWALNDAVTPGQDITVEVRPVSGGTLCEAGSSCSCNGLNAFRVRVKELPALYDIP